MKQNIIIGLLLLFSMLGSSLYAQDECVTELTQAQIDYMNATRLAREDLDVLELRNQITILPLVAHIVRETNGTGGLSDADLSTAMTDLNAAFAQVNFEFDLCEVRYIDNSGFNNGMSIGYDNTTEEYQMAIPNRVPGKVNVFFIENMQYCGWSSFPSFKTAYDKDWTVMKNSCAINGSTFPHELGHWLNLYHTHQGVSGGIGIVAKELVDGSNCGPNVGDELCDTPADPRLSGCVSPYPSCNYTCSYTDANGDPYSPDTSNLMSYSQKLCRTFFSDQQITRMQQSYLFDRNDLTLECDVALSCLISSISVNNASACDDNGTPATSDDTFTANVTISYLGAPDTGTLNISVAGGGSESTAQFGGSSYTFTNVTMPANGQAVSITASFSAETTCTLTNSNAHPGMTCMQVGPCQISGFYLWGITNCQDNGTPDDPTDDFFNAVIRVYNQDPPTSGSLVVTGDANVSVPVSQLNNTNYHNFYNVSLPADGTPIALTAYFSAESSCSYSSSNVYGGKPPCSSSGSNCDVNATITQTISGTFIKEVSNTITANNDIQNGANAIYNAGYEITLTDGFDAVYGSGFHGYIDGCGPDDETDTDVENELVVNDLEATLGHLRNFPNPFDQYTTIELLLNKEALVTIEVYGIDGRFIDRPLKNERRTQGTHQFNFDSSQLSPGTYLCRVRTDNELKVMKMTVMR